MDRNLKCVVCENPIGLCPCAFDDYGVEWSFKQAFRREAYPEAYSEYMLTHVIIEGHTYNVAD